MRLSATIATALVITLLVPASLRAGAIVTRDRKVNVGDVTVTAHKVLLAIKSGKITYKKDSLLWFTANGKVNSLYYAGLFALKKERKDIARIFFEKSAKAEPKNREKALAKLYALKADVRKTAVAAAAENAPVSPEVNKGASTRDDDAKAPAADNTISKLLKSGLLKNSKSRLKPYKDPQFGAKKYYAIYFSAHWCGPCHRFTPTLVDFYNDVKKKYPDDFELVFMSRGKSSGAMKKYVRQYDMPWPVVKFSKARNHKLLKHMGRGIPSLVILDGDGKVISDSYVNGKYVGPAKPMRDLERLLKAAN